MFKRYLQVMMFLRYRIWINKAGYTAMSCGRVGRGGNARFPTFRLDHYGPTDGRTDGRTYGRTDGPTYGCTDGRTDGQNLLYSCVSATKKTAN